MINISQKLRAHWFLFTIRAKSPIWEYGNASIYARTPGPECYLHREWNKSIWSELCRVWHRLNQKNVMMCWWKKQIIQKRVDSSGDKFWRNIVHISFIYRGTPCLPEAIFIDRREPAVILNAALPVRPFGIFSKYAFSAFAKVHHRFLSRNRPLPLLSKNRHVLQLSVFRQFVVPLPIRNGSGIMARCSLIECHSRLYVHVPGTFIYVALEILKADRWSRLVRVCQQRLRTFYVANHVAQQTFLILLLLTGYV